MLRRFAYVTASFLSLALPASATMPNPDTKPWTDHTKGVDLGQMPNRSILLMHKFCRKEMVKSKSRIAVRTALPTRLTMQSSK